MSSHPLPKTVNVTRTLIRMREDTPIETVVLKTLIDPGDDTTPPLYDLTIKTTIGPAQ